MLCWLYLVLLGLAHAGQAVLALLHAGVRAELTQGTAQNVVDVENLFHCILTHLSPHDHKEINHRVCFTLLALLALLEDFFHCILTHLSPHDHKEINHRVCLTRLLASFTSFTSLHVTAHRRGKSTCEGCTCGDLHIQPANKWCEQHTCHM